MYNLYFVSPHVPSEGFAAEQAEARVPLRNPAGNVIGWHCLVNQAQYDYHSARNGRPFNKAPAGASKKLNYTSAATGQAATKDCPTHQFAGVQIDDQETKKIIICDKVDDEDLTKPVAVQAPGMVDSERG